MAQHSDYNIDFGARSFLLSFDELCKKDIPFVRIFLVYLVQFFKVTEIKGLWPRRVKIYPSESINNGHLHQQMEVTNTIGWEIVYGTHFSS